MVKLEHIEDMSWFKEGLEEIGLSLSQYKKLNRQDKKIVDDALKEMGHLW